MSAHYDHRGAPVWCAEHDAPEPCEACAEALRVRMRTCDHEWVDVSTMGKSCAGLWGVVCFKCGRNDTVQL